MVTETAKRLLKRVRTIRENLGLSQEAFAERAGLKYKHYQSVEAGRKYDIKFSTLEKIAQACEMELWELLHFESNPLAVAEEPTDGKGNLPTRKKKRRRETSRGESKPRH